MYIKVKVIANAKKETLEKENETTLAIKVKEEAKGNRANKRVVELVAEYYDVEVGQVRIINGHHHPHKLISIQDSSKEKEL